MRTYLTRLFAHEAWANRELITSLLARPAVPPRTRELVQHLLITHEFRRQRLEGRDEGRFRFWPDHAVSLADCAAQNEEFARYWPEYLAMLADPLDAHTVSFAGRDGTSRYTFRVVDALTQLHSHSVHHCAQIIVDLRAVGQEPVNTDYIRYCVTEGARQ